MSTWALLIWFTTTDQSDTAFIQSRVGIQIMQVFNKQTTCEKALAKVKVQAQRTNGVCIEVD